MSYKRDVEFDQLPYTSFPMKESQTPKEPGSGFTGQYYFLARECGHRHNSICALAGWMLGRLFLRGEGSGKEKQVRRRGGTLSFELRLRVWNYPLHPSLENWGQDSVSKRVQVARRQEREGVSDGPGNCCWDEGRKEGSQSLEK